METNPESRWLVDRLASVTPKWSPNPARARVLLETKLAPRRHTSVWLTAAAMAVIAIPQSRALAQDLWFRLFLNRVDVVRVDLSKLPVDTKVTANGEEVVPNIDQAELKAGFKPHLPAREILPETPAFTVIGSIAVHQTIQVRELEAALAKAGARDVAVPAEWQGVTLRIQSGPIVTAGYPGEIQILQARPFELFVPSGFPLVQFAETAFRSIGLSWWEARALGQRFAAHPAWLLDVPTDEAANLQEVALRSGRGLLIEDHDDRGAVGRVTLIYSTPERIYFVGSPAREMCLRIANSLP